MPDDASRDGYRSATPQEIEALANATRLRILRLTLEREVTNRELADALGLTPAATLYHVRKLVSAGLLQAQPPRTRAAGGVEIPYRSDGRSWSLELPASVRPNDAILAAFVAEVSEAGPRALQHATRLRTRLTTARRAELTTRMRALWEEFADDSDGEPWSLFFALHHDDS